MLLAETALHQELDPGTPGERYQVVVGARTRSIPPALRRALHHRDQSCRFPGGGVRVAEGPHVQHWARGGPTTMTNLILLCRWHHRAVHEEGYRVTRGPEGALRFSRPDGREWPDVPSPAAVPDDTVGALRSANEARHVQIHPSTACARWLGERLDLAWTIDVLRSGLVNPDRYPL